MVTRYSSWVRRSFRWPLAAREGKRARIPAGQPGQLPASTCKLAQVLRCCFLRLPLAHTPAPSRSPTPLHNSLRVDCLPPSGAHLGNRISRTSLANDGRQTRRGGGAHAGPKDGAQTRASTSTTRDRFAPTPFLPWELNPHGILMGPQGQAAWAARRPPMTMEKPSNECIGPASFCSAASLLCFALLCCRC